MNQDYKKEWLAALRSGEYEQGNLYLRRNNSEDGYTFCCLGVLCDIYLKKNNLTWNDRPGNFDKPFSELKSLPAEVTSVTGVTSLGYLGDKTSVEIEEKYNTGCYQALSGLNDVAKFSFPVIADIIEEYIDKEEKHS
ncbi:hypothetical protein UFOVP434_99 [uncultured Caudovirales phage]|uniref:Uncharacterized protein n=1 Tax=uncultured Caudovirales phage TaxID=2100421 RepID=A0A6J5ME26_9CAUD|nr:hypothetical protein UFOVP434_99 [uncultured Caudovirales phage]